MDWTIKIALVDGHDYIKSGIRKKFKKNVEPVKKMLANLESVRQDLENDIQINNIGRHLKSEKSGVYRIGQGDRKLVESRLYVYFFMEGSNIVLLNVGTKQRQSEDISEAVRIKEHFLETKESIDFGASS